MPDIQVFDDRSCLLGEGPLWHPVRQQLFWFDIDNRKLLSRTPSGPLEWQLDEHFSAAAWIDGEHLLLASETGLWRFPIDTGRLEKKVDIEAGLPSNRSNDGRADPYGGFWIGTMSKTKRPGAGAIYRYHEGRLAVVVEGLTIPNSICFAPDGRTAYYTDTPTARIHALALDENGWPVGEARLFADLSSQGLHPDGSVVDAEGAVWNAQWGASRLARYLPDGSLDRTLTLPVPQCSCPAFGGPGLDQLFITTATEDMTPTELAAAPLSGWTFVAAPGLKGIPERAVRV